MNDINQNNEPLKDLMKHHQVTSAPDDFTDNVMSMIESNVILEEDTKPIISKKLIYAVAAVFVILFGLSFVVDLSLFNVQGLRETISSGDIQGIFASFLQVANYLTAIFKEISSNNLFLIIPAAIGSLIALDNLLKKKPRHDMVMI
ncbi:MAG: hypothetical protein K9J27_08205 [Bacteroidales bacterium]|nr:hypothetical protein [Bacteroidales bacterium]MCF8334013.1 hypothetical protein [Bacteroidales bacterium]